jgi:Domain of unknown function (DUF4326)
MCLDLIKPECPLLRLPQRVQRSRGAKADPCVVHVGAGTKWASPIKRHDVETLVSSEPDIARAFHKGGWKLAALVLYRDHLLEEGLDPIELQGKDLSCTCKATDPCHADVLIELANA